MSVNGNEEPRWRDLSPIQFSCNCNYSLITHNKTAVHSTWGLLRVCAACPTPRLNLSSELLPSWEQHPRYFPHRVCSGYNTALIVRIHTVPSKPVHHTVQLHTVTYTVGRIDTIDCPDDEHLLARNM